MRKRIQLISILISMCMTAIIIHIFEMQKMKLQVENGLSLEVSAGIKEETLLPWFDEKENKYYFFMPSFMKNEKIFMGKNQGIKIDGEKAGAGSFQWEEGKEYSFEVSEGADSDAVEQYNVVFMCSSNIPAVFIETESKSMDYIVSNKENEEKGSIDIIVANGNVEYSGGLEKISGRGNSSWEPAKKPFAFSLKEKKALCGMEQGKKWYLLNGWRDSNKMTNKLAFDMAEELGLAYSPQATWVDLYLNGEYAGNYLLCESVSVGTGRVDIYDLEKENLKANPDIEAIEEYQKEDEKGYKLENINNITGGYLIEKDYSLYYDNEKAGFITQAGFCFSIKEPKYIDEKQIGYIKNYVQNIENLLESKSEDCWKYVDIDSFSKKFLVDEISMNFDTGITSMFFYKERENDLLYAGPVWDYDSAMGNTKVTVEDGRWVNYRESVLQKTRVEAEKLNWYDELYQNERFYSEVIDNYRTLLPFLEETVNEKIDVYADVIRDSVNMDTVRWQNEKAAGGDLLWGHYSTFDDNVRYIKYFLANRINYLNERWDITSEELTSNSDESSHTVSFSINGSVVKEVNIRDGQCLDEMPVLDNEKYQGWYSPDRGDMWSEFLPIYEDMILSAQEKLIVNSNHV